MLIEKKKSDPKSSVTGRSSFLVSSSALNRPENSINRAQHRSCTQHCGELMRVDESGVPDNKNFIDEVYTLRGKKKIYTYLKHERAAPMTLRSRVGLELLPRRSWNKQNISCWLSAVSISPSYYVPRHTNISSIIITRLRRTRERVAHWNIYIFLLRTHSV